MNPITKINRLKVPWYGILLLPVLILCNCAKEKAVIIPVKDGPLTIGLCDKPLDTIKKYIQGNWKYVYGIGGWGPAIHKCDSCYIEFTKDDRVIRMQNFQSDTFFIRWEKGIFPCAVYDSNYAMYCYIRRESQTTTLQYIIEGIDHDTLEFHDHADDGIYYHYIKTIKK